MADAKISITVDGAQVAQQAAENVAKAVQQVGDATGQTAQGTSALSQAIADLKPSTDNAATAFTSLKTILTNLWDNPTEALKTLSGAIGTDLTASLGSAGVAAGAAAAGVLALGAATYELADRAATVGAALNDMSEKTGISVPALSNLKGAAEIAGGSLDQVANAVFMFQRNMAEGSQKFSDGLDRIHVSLADIQSLSPDQQFLKIAEAIRNTEDPAQRAAAAMELFGRQGRDLLPLMMKPLGDLVEQSKALGLTWSEEDAKAAEDFEMKSRALKLELEGMATTAGRTLIPAMLLTVEVAERTALAFVHIADLGGLVSGGYHLITGALGENALAAQVVAAQQDTITRAHELGAPAGLKYGDAVKYINDQFEKNKPAEVAAAASADDWLKKLSETITKAKDAEAAQARLTEGLANMGIVQGLTADDVAAMNTQYDKNAEAAKRMADENAKLLAEFATVGATVTDTITAMDGAVVESTKYYLEHGVSVEKIAKLYGLTVEQVKAVQSELKFEQSVLDATTKTFKDHDQILGLVTDHYGALHDAVEAVSGDPLHALAMGMDLAAGKTSSATEIAQQYRDALSQVREEEAKATDATVSFGQSLMDALGSLPQLIQQGLTGGGGLAGAIGAAGAGLGAVLGKSIVGAIPGSMTSLLGSSLGGAMDIALPGIGAALGSLVGPLLGKLMNIGGPSQQELQGRQTEGQFEQQMGGWQGIQKALLDTGMAADQVNAKIQALWAAEKQGTGAVQTQIDSINAVLAAEKQRATDVQAAVTAIGTAAQATGGSVPASMRPMIDQLLQMKGLTDDEKNALIGLTQDVKPNFQQLQQTAANYGISLAALGPAFQQAHIEATAKGIFDDFTSLTKAGADVGGVLYGMRDPIAKLVQDSKNFGTAIPDNMKPLIDELVRSGNLLDANGNKITDLADVKFEGTPIDTGMNNLATAIQKLTDLLAGKGGVTDALDAVAQHASGIPTNIPIDVQLNGHWNIPDAPPTSFAGEGFDISRPTRAVVGDAPGQSESILHASTVRDIVQASRNAGASVSTAALESKIDALHATMRGVMQEFTTAMQLQPAMLRHALRGAR